MRYIFEPRTASSREPSDEYETLSKKEIARIEKEKRKLHKNLDGIRRMSQLPDAVFVVDTRREKIAVDIRAKAGYMGLLGVDQWPAVALSVDSVDDPFRAGSQVETIL